MPEKKVSIFIEESFDYSHFLPATDKCFPLHGHTSIVHLKIDGKVQQNGMVMDFSEAKQALRKILIDFDHKLITNKKYTSFEDKGLVSISYDNFKFQLPLAQAFLLEGEGTSEDIALAIAERLADVMPANVSSICLSITEGTRKGTEIFIKCHKR